MVTLGELRARFAAIHPPDRVARAEAAALLACSVAVYQSAGARREAAERAVELALEALASARENEAEWAATCHGLAVRLAVALDSEGSIAFLNDSDEVAT